MTTEQLEKRNAADDAAFRRGQRFQAGSNDLPVIMEFQSRGLNPADVITFGPAQNVRTYRAWRALGRQVRKGEKSVRCTVWAHREKKGAKPRADGTIPETSFPVIACVFHVSQTDAIEGPNPCLLST